MNWGLRESWIFDLVMLVLSPVSRYLRLLKELLENEEAARKTPRGGNREGFGGVA